MYLCSKEVTVDHSVKLMQASTDGTGGDECRLSGTYYIGQRSPHKFSKSMLHICSPRMLKQEVYMQN